MKEVVLAHFQRLFGRSNRDVSLENEWRRQNASTRMKEVKAKCMKEDVRKSFSRLLADWHLVTSLYVDWLIHRQFSGIFSYEVRGKYLWNYLVVGILQLILEISSLLWNRWSGKLLKSTGKHKKQSSGGVL